MEEWDLTTLQLKRKFELHHNIKQVNVIWKKKKSGFYVWFNKTSPKRGQVKNIGTED